jgi:hypothetical protein
MQDDTSFPWNTESGIRLLAVEKAIEILHEPIFHGSMQNHMNGKSVSLWPISNGSTLTLSHEEPCTISHFFGSFIYLLAMAFFVDTSDFFEDIEHITARVIVIFPDYLVELEIHPPPSVVATSEPSIVF